MGIVEVPALDWVRMQRYVQLAPTTLGAQLHVQVY